MRYIKPLILVCLAFFFLLSPVKAEVIREFNSDIAIDEDGAVQVIEKIKMDFEGDERHGIIRQIPISVTRKQVPYSISYKLISVTDGDDHPLKFQQTRDGAEVDLKIGEPGEVVTGVHTYKIKYVVNRVINFINDRPEFYWNATGDQWRFVIENAYVRVHVPPKLPVHLVNYTSFYGKPGSRTPASQKLGEEPGEIDFLCKSLAPGQGLTVAVSLPIGTMHRPTVSEELMNWLADWWQAILFPLCAFSAMFALWWTGGRDVGGGKAIAVEWNPPKELTPAEVGTLVDERCDMHDITSTLVDLAARGHLKIKEIKTETLFFLSNKDYEFEKIEPPASDAALTGFEKLFLVALFTDLKQGTTVRLSRLKGSFYPYLATIRSSIYDSLTTKKLFRHDPEKTRTIYFGVAMFVFVVALVALAYSVPSASGLLLASIIVACFAPAMPSRTAKGSELTRNALGFARYIKMAEKERIKVLAAEDPTIFGRLLPYAMVLGAADQWAQAFKDLSIQPPDWYVASGDYPSYSTSIFLNDLGASLRSVEQTFSSAPVSATNTSSAWSNGSAFDGGGSGGGFGGGGGNSW